MKRLLILLITLSLLGCQSQQKPLSNENSSIYYQIFVGSFYDSNNDGIGDLKGIEKKLPYLDLLQIKGLWLSPIHPSDSYHKYDVKDYYGVDPNFGTIEDFEHLVNEAKRYDINIIIDLVLNHTSSNHPWFIQAKSEAMNHQCDKEDSICDYYHFYQERENNTVKLQENLYYEAGFSDMMPDLNLDNKEVRASIEDIVVYWLGKGVKGFRLDAPMHYYPETSKTVGFLSWFENIVKSHEPEAFVVGEVWSNTQTILDHYESGIDSLFNFPASSTDGKITNYIRSGMGKNLAEWMDGYDQKLMDINPNIIDSVFLSNHDQGRSGGYFKAFEEKQRLMIDVLLLSKGRPYIYYGEEIGMLGSGNDPNKRQGMLWGEEQGQCDNPIGTDFTSQIDSNLKMQLEDENSMFHHYLKAITLRNKYTCFESGVITSLPVEDPSIYAMYHEGVDERVIVLHNFSDEIKSYTLTMNYTSYDSLYDMGENTIEDNIVTLVPYSSMVIEVEG